MNPELQELVDTITKLNQVEADFLKHSEKFWECREDILRHIHESCHTVSRKVHIQIAGTETVMVGGDDFEQRLALATPSHKRKRNNAWIDDDNGNHGEASVSVHHQSPAHEQNPILTEDHVIQGEASESTKQSTAQEPKPMSTEKYDNHGILNERFEQHLQDLDIPGILNERFEQHRQDFNEHFERFEQHLQDYYERFEQHRQDFNERFERFEQHIQDLNERFKQHSQDVDIHGNGNKSIEHSTSTKDVDIHGNGNNEHSTSTKDVDIHGNANKSSEHSTSNKSIEHSISTKDFDIHGDANKSIEHSISTIDVDIHGDAKKSVGQQVPTVSIFGDGPLYPHCVETWEATNAKLQQIARPAVTPASNVRKFW
ncbi:hypothetical protein BDR22DRAFT_816478 [Usnea florida]